ncbi:MAG: hypothetical protein OHK0056_13660 [Bacteriovoracaceae bacterium]
MQENELETIRAKGSEQSRGDSSYYIHQTILGLAAPFCEAATSICDVGCGNGKILKQLRSKFPRTELHGIDIGSFFDPNEINVNFHKVDLNEEFPQALENHFDVVISSEVIEHLENPRHFIRQLTKVVRPKGVIILSTPNTHSILSLLTYDLKGHHNAFGPKDYPAHITAVSPYDLKQMIKEIPNVHLVKMGYVHYGRIPGTGISWQQILPILNGKSFSDNYFVVMTKNE